MEAIPFTETRDYLKAVMRNAGVHRRLYGQQPPRWGHAFRPAAALLACALRAVEARFDRFAPQDYNEVVPRLRP